MRTESVRKSKNWLRLWLGMAALVLCILVGRETTQAFSSKNSMLYVDGVYLVQRGELLCTTLTKGNGTVTYDANTNVLTLENYEITGAPGMGIQDMPGLKIVLKGTNNMNVTGSGIHAYLSGNITFCGGGTLNITAGAWERSANGILMQATDVSIENCTLNIYASYMPLGGTGIVNIKDSTIKAVRTGVAEVNDENQNNNIYNLRYSFPGLSATNLIVENSNLDITGYNYGIDIDETVNLGENMVVTDENGQNLHIVKVHWPYWWMNGIEETYTLAYSATTAEEVYNFDELPKRVLIKTIQIEPEQNGDTEENDTGDNQTDGNNGNNSANGDTGNTDAAGENQNSENNSANSDTDNTDAAGESKNPEGTSEDGGNTTNSEKNQVTQKINRSYYRGVPSSGKVSYVKPASKKITKVTIPATVKINGYVCKVTAIDKNAFKGCKKLKTVKIGKNVQTIGERAFYQCTALKKIGIPGNVKSIKKEAFAGCKNLQNVTFQGKKVTFIGKNAFKNTKKKIKISVPKSKYKTYKKLLKGTGLKSPVYKKIA
ncbi:MAG: leucine-rich repeat domain-containing protein [Eubacterium sp.]|nr:leucine-rich repeat domain-containing protein [Eubacterium sp.]